MTSSSGQCPGKRQSGLSCGKRAHIFDAGSNLWWCGVHHPDKRQSRLARIREVSERKSDAAVQSVAEAPETDEQKLNPKEHL